MRHIDGSIDEIRARVPAVRESWEFMRDNVLLGGIVDPGLKRLCFRFVAEEDVRPSNEREALALRWAQAIGWDSDLAGDDLWEALHAKFSEPELVELGCAIGFALGQQHFERTLGLPPHAGLS
jgi:alkylhydroperoxidase family enzyme